MVLEQELAAGTSVSARSGYYDLIALAGEIHREYFPGIPRISIRWGHRVSRKTRRSIRLGSYDHRSAEIRVHPSLDVPRVPRFFIQSIIFHEYLHHVLGPAHNRRFHHHERSYRYHRESKEWLKRNLFVLLGRRARSRATRAVIAIFAPPQFQLPLF